MDRRKGSDKISHRENIKFFADIILKLTPAIATVVMGWIAFDFQSKSSAATLLNQREQAETQLRVALFENLIGPLGGTSGGGVLDADHQRLLVELLMLNFHEHIEFKPLLIHADERLVKEIENKSEARKLRKSLRSVARRVRERQVAVLMKEHKSSPGYNMEYMESKDGVCSPYGLQCDFFASDNAFDKDKVWEVRSPDGKYSIRIRIKEMDWDNEHFEVSLIITNITSAQSRASSFKVTSYDLPFTDNMIIGRNQRFALGVTNVDLAKELYSREEEGENVVTLQAVWFPKDYILPHERPVNYQEIRELLRLEDEDQNTQQQPRK